MSQGRNGLEITIEPGRRSGQSLMLLVWLAGWAAAELAVLRELMGTSDAAHRIMLAVFLVAWTFAGFMAARAMLFSLGGRERIRINGTELEHVVEAPLMRRRKLYEMSRVSNLRVGRGRPPRPSGRPADRRPRKGRIRQTGRVVFDYDGREAGFGQSLDTEEAAAIVKELHARFRQLEPASRAA
jgi:hypothetical protein